MVDIQEKGMFSHSEEHIFSICFQLAISVTYRFVQHLHMKSLFFRYLIQTCEFLLKLNNFLSKLPENNLIQWIFDQNLERTMM